MRAFEPSFVDVISTAEQRDERVAVKIRKLLSYVAHSQRLKVTKGQRNVPRLLFNKFVRMFSHKILNERLPHTFVYALVYELFIYGV